MKTKPKVICLVSVKGGTGKSSITIELANVLSEAGYNVVVMDMDINNSCSLYYLDNDEEKGNKNIAAALQGKDLKEYIIPTSRKNISILQSSLYLVDLRTLATNRLKTLMPSLGNVYDYVIIDTSPTYDNLVLASMEASDMILTPVLMAQFDYNTALFLDGKLKTETDLYDRWKIVYNGYDKRFDTFKKSSQKDYRELFEKRFKNILPFECCLPWTTQVRRYIDRGEKITKEKHAKLWDAIISLASFVSGEEIKIPGGQF
jgi:chromosome partitioning protein